MYWPEMRIKWKPNQQSFAICYYLCFNFLDFSWCRWCYTIPPIINIYTNEILLHGEGYLWSGVSSWPHHSWAQFTGSVGRNHQTDYSSHILSYLRNDTCLQLASPNATSLIAPTSLPTDDWDIYSTSYPTLRIISLY